jgi:hypothetical protein
LKQPSQPDAIELPVEIFCLLKLRIVQNDAVNRL